MNRRDVLAFAGAAAAGLSGPALGQATRWNLPSGYAASNFHTENLMAFARDVEQATNGRIAVAVHAGGSLFPVPQIKRAVATGQAQLGEILISVHENEDPIFGIDVVPFLATSYGEARRLWAVSKAATERRLNAQGLTALYAVAWPPQGLYAAGPINSVEDLRGKRWRAYNAGTTRIAELAGMQSVTVQAAELPQALATGVVNAFMTSGATGYDSKVWESPITHFYDCQAWLPKNIILVNSSVFNALDGATKEALLRAAAAAEQRGWAKSEELSGWYQRELASKGMTVGPPSAQLMAGLRRFGEQLTADWVRRAGADGQTVIDAYRRSA
jgi:TRAP-type C4-dicarboxylate transport system substrate-binding protein